MCTNHLRLQMTSSSSRDSSLLLLAEGRGTSAHRKGWDQDQVELYLCTNCFVSDEPLLLMYSHLRVLTESLLTSGLFRGRCWTCTFPDPLILPTASAHAASCLASLLLAVSLSHHLTISKCLQVKTFVLFTSKLPLHLDPISPVTTLVALQSFKQLKKKKMLPTWRLGSLLTLLSSNFSPASL